VSEAKVTMKSFILTCGLCRYTNDFLLSLRMKHSFLLLLLLFISIFSKAQIGGSRVFDFLSVAPSARATAFGGTSIMVMDNDVTEGFQNPALYNPTMDQNLSLNILAYLDGISYSTIGYSHTFDKIGTVAAGLEYFNYGQFNFTDDIGTNLGTFNANEYAFIAGISRNYNNKFTYGLNLKFVGGTLESYHASGITGDFGIAYNDTAHSFTASAVLQNFFSLHLKNYITDQSDPYPFDIKVGVSKKFPHTPFRFFIVASNLYIGDIRYNDPNAQQESALFVDSSQLQPKNYLGDKILRHFTFGTELAFGKAVSVQVSYNDLRHQELAFDGAGGAAGLSFGAGIKTKKFSINYGHAIYNVAGGSNHFSLDLNMDALFGKKTM
jgi:hypothetical protein